MVPIPGLHQESGVLLWLLIVTQRHISKHSAAGVESADR
jgi:hypothetical protein